MPLKIQHDDRVHLDLTPMIDVVFLLIIFFMVATKFTELEHDIGLQLPEVNSATPLTSAPRQRVVNVHDDGRATLDGQEVTLAELTTQLAGACRDYPQLSVVIRGDASSPFQHIAAVLAACKDAHVTELGITVRIADHGQPTRR